ncbi:hypothetical protein ACEPPN_006437 [Leptodophora sp. 'Broadleaf-Isolate-01']
MELLKKFLLLAWVLCALLVENSVSTNLGQIQSLSAITPRSKMHERNENFTPSLDCEHHYIDHVSLLEARPIRFAKTTMHLKTPAIAVEDIESYLTAVTCSDTFMTLTFIDKEVLQHAKAQWEEDSSILFIMAREGCNPAGSRAPYLVSLVSEDRATNTLEFSSESLAWDEAYDTIEVSFGVATKGDDYNAGGLRQHAELSKRQDDSSFISFDTDPTILLMDETNYPDLPSTSDETSSTNAPSDISFSFLGQQLIQGLKCIDCSLNGDISIQDTTSSDSSNWSLAVIANGVSAHIEIEASLNPQVDTLEFNVPVQGIMLDTFSIGGIAVVAPEIVVEVFGKITASVDVDVSWGFDITIPDGSYIQLTSNDETDLSLSTSGFNKTEINQLPFNASISNPAITPVIGLRFNFLLAVSPVTDLDLVPSMYAGVYIDLPKLSADFEFVTDANALCETIDSEETDPDLQITFPNLLIIQPSAAMALGGVVGVCFESTGFGFDKLEGFNFPGLNPSESEASGTETETATRTAAGVTTAITEAGVPVTSVPSAGTTPVNTSARTSSSTPIRTSGAAAETSSNAASSNKLKISEQSRFACTAGILTLVFVFVGTVL